ncbi:MAG TPA: hypothetical protein VGT03_00465 [Candidatus Acidoferrales bacterium]|nr:hypothetical protein [Candidatus Acidoferrales bacterium]
MRKTILGAILLSLLVMTGAGNNKDKPKPPAPPLKVVMSPASTVPTADIVKNLLYKCANVTITLDSTKSDFMLEAAGWPGNYKFTVFKHGGDAVFSTNTHFLSNAVKDVCKYVNSPNK